MRLLGIDYGTKRIGLATGDTDTSLAFPLRTIPNDGVALAAIAAAVKDEGADRIVVGMPTRLAGEGSEGDVEAAVRAFVERLRSAVTIPIETEDERMTSAVADRLRKDADRKERDFDRDAHASAILLESYIQRMK